MNETLLGWLVGVGVPVALFTFGMWLRSESRRRDQFDQLKKDNDEQHAAIRDDMAEHRDTLRDRIEAVWKHLVDRKD